MSSDSIIVVGAGSAGITAARDLVRAGYTDVRILEASDRYLGRLRKDDDFVDFPIDLGGQWVTGNTSVLDEIIDDPNTDMTMALIPNTMDVFLYLPNLERQVQIDKATDIIARSDDKFVGNATYYDFFNTYLVPDVIGNMELNCAVQSINYSNDDSITVESSCGAYLADHVIVAVPLKILQDDDIFFEPALPRNKLRALRTATWADGITVFIEFDEHFFEDRLFQAIDDFWNYGAESRYFWDESFGEYTDRFVLGMLVVGELANEYIQKSDEEIVVAVLEDLDEIFDGQATPSYLQHVVQNWSMEPYVRGLYSFYAPSEISLQRTLQEPIQDRLHFAGEYIPMDITHYGYADGAALSGRRAASEIIL